MVMHNLFRVGGALIPPAIVLGLAGAAGSIIIAVGVVGLAAIGAVAEIVWWLL